ncbi:MAG: hypothetical protein M0018_11705 [Nitrospiraceae bacterium]|nr:hypothetical protein [Nitrospiraceae bacterium]
MLLAACAGLWTSYHYTFTAWGLDSDSSVFVMLMHGWQNHGWGFFRSWLYTRDNWLLSSAPLAFLDYKVFGATGRSVIGLGWAVFAANAFLAATVMRLLLGRWSPAALVVSCLCLFAGEDTIGSAGAMAFSAFHNATMLWILLAIMVVFAEKAKGFFWRPLVLCAIVFIASLSDPWFNAACALPLALVLLWRQRAGKESRRQNLALLTGLLGGWVLAGTKAFGAFSFLHGYHFHFALNPEQVLGNLRLYLQAIAVLFQAALVWRWNHAVGVLFVGLSLFLAANALLWLARPAKQAGNLKGPELSLRQRGALNFFMISSAIISGLFFLYSYDADAGAGAGRYLINIYYGMLVLGVFVYAARWVHLTAWMRAAAVVWVLVFIMAGAASNPGAWTKRAKINDLGAAELAQFLESNGLRYGYGDYWGARANTVSWISGFRTIVRPVLFHDYQAGPEGAPVRKYLFFIPRLETSRLWNLDADSKNAGRVFLVLNGNEPFEGNPYVPIPVLAQTASEEFGKPGQVLQFQNFTILVWDHPILPALRLGERIMFRQFSPPK